MLVYYGNKYELHFPWRFLDNKAKGRISKRVFQGNKARHIFRKTNISYPLIGERELKANLEHDSNLEHLCA